MRLFSIDLSRALAIVLMILVHFTENLSGHDILASAYAAPMFAFLVGVSHYLWVEGQLESGRSEAEVARVTIRRGVFLFVIGLVFNVVAWTPQDLFIWDILTFMGAAMVVLGVARQLSPRWLMAIAVLSFLVAPILRILTEYPEYWLQGYYDYDLNPSEILTGFLSNGYFPLFPWLLFPILGFAVAGFAFESPARTLKRMLGLAILGAGLIIAGISVVMPHGISDNLWMSAFFAKWSEFPASPRFILIALGAVLMFWCLAFLAFDRPGSALFGRFIRQKAVFTRVSQYSLSIYIIHHLVHLWPLWLYGAYRGAEDVTEYFRSAMPVSSSLPLGVLTILLSYPLALWLHRRRNLSLEYWMRRFSES